jgi:inner membrane protein
MPSTVGHSLLGYAIHRGTADGAAGRSWLVPLLCVFAANAADLDILPGLLMGEPNRFHRGISHSIGIAVLFAAVFGPVLAACGGGRLKKATGLAFLLYLSHLVADCFNADGRFPFGVPLLWPLTATYYIAPFPLLLDIHKAGTSGAFLPSLLSVHNLVAMAVEVLVFLPVVGLVWAWKRRADPRGLNLLVRE